MTIQEHRVKQCAGASHLYASAFLMRCMHREEYVLNWTAYVDQAYGQLEILDQGSVTFGPFDTLDAARAHATEAFFEAVTRVQDHSV